MAGFVLTPGGIKPLEEAATPAGGVVPAGQFVETLKNATAAHEEQREVTASIATQKAKGQRLERRQYAIELRGRLRVVEREIKALRALEEERAEIKRLLAALKAPPAKVTDISSARKSG
jgi:hypothetical protein